MITQSNRLLALHWKRMMLYRAV